MQQRASHGHAVVIGASIAGLFTARVLSEYFAQVTLLERDPVQNVPHARKGQPQARHTHVMLEPARRLMRHYFPEVEPMLIEGGAQLTDACKDTFWFCFDGYRQRVPAGFQSLTVTRPFLEHHVREAVLRRAKIRLEDNTRVDALLWDDDHARICGVEVSRRGADGGGQGTLRADLVVDTSGRGSPLAKWLAAEGYERPEREEVKIGVRYTTRVYRRQAHQAAANPVVFVTTGNPPTDRMAGAMVPVEGNRWFLTMGGWHGASAPTDEAGFLDAVRRLPTSDIYDVISTCEPLSEPMPFHYPSSQRYHYERLRRFPEGLLALGDAVASFNPVYGQGMSSAALQAEALDMELGRHSRHPLWRRFFARQGQLIDNVWAVAVGEDFRFPETIGPKPQGTDISNRYGEWIHRAAQRDGVVARQLVNVIHLRASPRSLMHPSILWRVLWARRGQAPRPR